MLLPIRHHLDELIVGSSQLGADGSNQHPDLQTQVGKRDPASQVITPLLVVNLVDYIGLLLLQVQTGTSWYP